MLEQIRHNWHWDWECDANVMNQQRKEKNLIRVNTPCLTASGTVSVTVEIKESTRVDEVKRKVLKRFKPGMVDPNIFTISVMVESENTHSVFVLRDDEEIMKLHHLWRHGPATYSLDASEPIKVRIYTGKVFPNHEYKTLVVAERTCSLNVLRMLLRNKKRQPEEFILIRQDLRDFNEIAIKHSEALGPFCRGSYGQIFLKKLKQPRNVKWDEKRLISFIDYDSPDEGMDDEGSEKGSSGSSILDYFSWISDSVSV